MNSTKNANKFMFSFMIYMSVLPYIFTFLITALFGTTDTMVYVLLTQHIFSFLVPILFYLGVTKQKFTDLVPIKKISLTNIIYLIIIGILVQPISSVFAGISSLFFTNDVSEVIVGLNYLNPVFLVFVIAVIPAFFEEMMFRGIISAGYRKKPPYIGAIMTGLFFGIMHLNAHQFLYASALGILLFYLVYYTGSVLSSVIVHFVINASQLLLSMSIPTDDVPVYEPTFYENLFSLLLVTIFALLVLPVFIYVLKAFLNYNKKNDNVIKTEYIEETKPMDKYAILSIIIWVLNLIINAYIETLV